MSDMYELPVSRVDELIRERDEAQRAHLETAAAAQRFYERALDAEAQADAQGEQAEAAEARVVALTEALEAIRRNGDRGAWATADNALGVREDGSQP